MDVTSLPIGRAAVSSSPMWQTFVTTFVTVFLAELGDKTQLATLGLTAEAKSKLMVFAGSAAALVATSLIAVLAGSAVAKAIPPVWLQRGAAVLFVVLGIWTFWKTLST
jgi:putative Ca2+/H+ antiporter (TMEM165/GDT1 family)